MPFIAITEAVASKIVNEQYSLLQRSLAVHEKLTKIVLEEKGLEAILSTLSALVGCSAVLFDFHGVVLCEAAYRRHLGGELIADLWRQICDRRANRQNFALSVDGVGSGVQVYPVVASHRIGAFLAVVKDSGDFSEYDRIILHNVVTVTALELVKKKAVAETEKRLAGDFFDELIASDLYEEEIARRLAFFGLDPQAPHLIVLVDIDGSRRRRRRGARNVVAPDIKERLHWAVDEFMARRDVLFISASHGDSVVILVQPGKLDAKARARARGGAAGVDRCSCSPRSPSSVGIGRPHRQLIDLRQSYYEASYAIKIRKLKGEPGVIASFDDLGSYGLLLGLQDTLSLEVFYDSVLGKLQEYDEQNTSDLVKSLACFLEANGHWGDAAEKLYVHRHTLRYRMKRVEEITGPRPRSVAGPHGVLAGPQGQGAHRPVQEGQDGWPADGSRPQPASRRAARRRARSGHHQRAVVDDDVDARDPVGLQAEAHGRADIGRQHQALRGDLGGRTQRGRPVLVVLQVDRPGATPQTRTPSALHARASSLTRWIWAALAAPCAAKAAHGCSPR